jgi:mannose/fructose/N-acetylgalactosamine-specific phosphotransferase system component IIC
MTPPETSPGPAIYFICRSDVIQLLLLAVWVGLDSVAVFQLMISQPLVAGALGGLALGAPGAGLLVGILLQVVWGRELPMGASSLPASGPAALAGGALAGVFRGKGTVAWGALTVPDATYLALILLVALGLGEFGRGMIRGIHRNRNTLFARADAAIERGDAGGLVRANLGGAVPYALVSILLVGIGLLVGSALFPVAAIPPPLDGRWVLLPVLGLGLGRTLSLAPARLRSWGALALLALVYVLGEALR